MRKIAKALTGLLMIGAAGAAQADAHYDDIDGEFKSASACSGAADAKAAEAAAAEESAGLTQPLMAALAAIAHAARARGRTPVLRCDRSLVAARCVVDESGWQPPPA